MTPKGARALALWCALSAALPAAVATESQELLYLQISARTREERSRIADRGVSIERVAEDYVIAIGGREDVDHFAERGLLKGSGPLDLRPLGFPKQDEAFHDSSELAAELAKLAAENPDLVRLETIGQSHEGREIFAVTLTTDPEEAPKRPGIVFMGGHHAREHLSVEIPLKLLRHLVAEFRRPDSETRSLIEARTIYIIPMVNPDGAEFDIKDGTYQHWRKNRRPNGGRSFGVDLNRNYGFQWATGGSSKNPNSETYHGPAAFSEPESVAIRDFIEARDNINVLLTFHTFSELILYPWGHTYNGIGVDVDRRVHEELAQQMARWNGYTPQQSSDLYIASGDTTDWAYGIHKIVSFTFELDPKSMWDGGFYPGAGVIDAVFQKNLKPCLHLIEYADNPYRVLEPKHVGYGFSTPVIR